MQSNTGLNHDNARTTEQKKLMGRIEKDDVCPFCAEHLKKYHPKPILKETEYWFVTTNMSPYEGTKHHFLFIYKPSHIRNIRELNGPALVELFTHVNELVEEHHIPGGSFFIRFGDTRYTGSSVEHLHAHLLTGDAADEDTEGIKVKLAVKKKSS